MSIDNMKNKLTKVKQKIQDFKKIISSQFSQHTVRSIIIVVIISLAITGGVLYLVIKKSGNSQTIENTQNNQSRSEGTNTDTETEKSNSSNNGSDSTKEDNEFNFGPITDFSAYDTNEMQNITYGRISFNAPNGWTVASADLNSGKKYTITQPSNKAQISVLVYDPAPRDNGITGMRCSSFFDAEHCSNRVLPSGKGSYYYASKIYQPQTDDFGALAYLSPNYTSTIKSGAILRTSYVTMPIVVGRLHASYAANPNDTDYSWVFDYLVQSIKALPDPYSSSQEGTELKDDNNQHSLTVNGVSRDVVFEESLLYTPVDFLVAFDVNIKNLTNEDFIYRHDDFSLVTASGSTVTAKPFSAEALFDPPLQSWIQMTLKPNESKRVLVTFDTRDLGNSESGTVYWQPEGLQDAIMFTYSSN